jgi:hypothetical protein
LPDIGAPDSAAAERHRSGGWKWVERLSWSVVVLGAVFAGVAWLLGLFSAMTTEPELKDLDVAVEWPVPSSACGGFPVAMPAGQLSIDSYAAMLTIEEDPRFTAVKNGGVPVGFEFLTMQVRNPNDVPAHIDRIGFPVVQKVPAAQMEWIADLSGGCGDGGDPDAPAVDPDPILRYDLSAGELTNVYPDGSTYDASSQLGPNFFGTAITKDEPFTLRIEVAACEGIRYWNVQIDFSIEGQKYHKTVELQNGKPFGLAGEDAEGPLIAVVPARTRQGREVIDLATDDSIALLHSEERFSACSTDS